MRNYKNTTTSSLKTGYLCYLSPIVLRKSLELGHALSQALRHSVLWDPFGFTDFVDALIAGSWNDAVSIASGRCPDVSVVSVSFTYDAFTATDVLSMFSRCSCTSFCAMFGWTWTNFAAFYTLPITNTKNDGRICSIIWLGSENCDWHLADVGSSRTNTRSPTENGVTFAFRFRCVYSFGCFFVELFLWALSYLPSPIEKIQTGKQRPLHSGLDSSLANLTFKLDFSVRSHNWVNSVTAFW